MCAQRGETALARAAGSGHVAIVKLLVQHGADVHTRSKVRP
jgi:ankyrin repeat protein